MKLTIIGGAGVRAPFMMKGLVAYAPRIDLQDVWLMDIDDEKLALIGGLCQALVQRYEAPFALHLTTDARAALEDADHVIMTIRVGAEAGRIKDERVALLHNVIGQETTGPGGFAMAMRSIPVILDYCRLIAEVAPHAWIHNFTNPAGLVTQAVREAGFERIIGVCDSANGAQTQVAHYLGIPEAAVQTEVFGLNHLSWTRSAVVNGTNRLPELLHDPAFIAASNMQLFDAALRERVGMFLNEYLHYYYYRDKVLAKLQAKEETRGEQVARLSARLLHELRTAQNPDEALRIHHRVMAARTATYMNHAVRDASTAQHFHEPLDDELGYAGVMLGCIEAMCTGVPHRTGLNVPNAGAIAGMRDDDVVEITCLVDDGGPHPLPIGEIPEHQYLLMRAVKRYERLATQAILNRDRGLAVEALFEHPLVGSFSLAEALVADYLEAHREYVGEWH